MDVEDKMVTLTLSTLPPDIIRNVMQVASQPAELQFLKFILVIKV